MNEEEGSVYTPHLFFRIFTAAIISLSPFLPPHLVSSHLLLTKFCLFVCCLDGALVRLIGELLHDVHDGILRSAEELPEEHADFGVLPAGAGGLLEVVASDAAEAAELEDSLLQIVAPVDVHAFGETCR